MDYKIQNIKDFLKHGPPQFDVLTRHTIGESINVNFTSMSEDLKFEFKEKIEPSSLNGIIKSVKRISDDQVIKTGDWVEINEESGFVVFFSEDRIHCDVVSVFHENEKNTVEIGDINIPTEVDEYEIGDIDNEEKDGDSLDKAVDI